jgi:predicted small lipoprotein YifL
VRGLILVLALTVALAACGKKPGALRPDEADKAPTYPRTYPIR